eukprot:240401-Chlamydomonas_euryale.AAC.12
MSTSTDIATVRGSLASNGAQLLGSPGRADTLHAWCCTSCDHDSCGPVAALTYHHTNPAVVAIPTYSPMTRYRTKSQELTMGSSARRGGCAMTLRSALLKPSAVAGRPSVTRLTHRSCTGVSTCAHVRVGWGKVICLVAGPGRMLRSTASRFISIRHRRSFMALLPPEGKRCRTRRESRLQKGGPSHWKQVPER